MGRSPGCNGGGGGRDMMELLEEVGENIVAVVLFLLSVGSVFIEVSKIKLNPWTALFKWIGNALNKELKDELKEVKSELSETKSFVKELEKLTDLNEIKRIRAEIFSFADSCRLDVKHTKENFLHIIDIHEDYETLLEKYDMKNGRISVDYDYIMKVYQECVRKGIIDIHDDYEKLLEKHNMENGRMTSEFNYIKDVYRVCMERDSFI